MIRDESIENAIVIMRDGTVKRCYGSLNGVWTDIDLGSDLRESIMIHNHPIGSNNEYSFSNEDINLFVDYEIKILQGIDEKYVYQLSKDDKSIDKALPIYKITEYDARSEKVKGIANDLGVGYKRWKHGDR